MASSLAIGIAARKAAIKSYKEAPRGKTFIVSTRDEAERQRDIAYDAGRSDLIFKTQSDIDWEAKAQERADARAAAQVARATHDDGSMVAEGHPLKELEATW